MRKSCAVFGVHLWNIPTINLRNEFVEHLHLLRQPSFREAIRRRERVETPFFTWHGSTDEAVSLLLQRAILGLESWIVGAAYMELGATGRLKENIGFLATPSKLQGRGMADNYYRRLPGLVYEDVALDRADAHLWNRTLVLYAEVRNPLMHGYQFEAAAVDGVLECFEHLAKLFRWTDTWHDWLDWGTSEKRAPVHLEARRMALRLPPDTPLSAEDMKLASEDLVKDGRCHPIPEEELSACQTMAEFYACAQRHSIPSPSSA